MNYTDEDFERLYIRYKAEGLPRQVTMKEFCMRNNVPFGRFDKWWRDTRHRVVRVTVDGMPEICDSETEEQEIPNEMESEQPTGVPPTQEGVIGRSGHPASLKEAESAAANSTAHPRIMIDIRMTNGLHLSRRNMTYPELRLLVERLEGLC